MKVRTEGPVKTFLAGEALVGNRRVGIKAGTTTSPPEVEYVDAGVQHIGITEDGTNAAAGEQVSIILRHAPGSRWGVAADTFSLGATLYGAVDGKISDTSSGTAIGLALEAATAAGDIVEWIPFPVVGSTAATVSIADAGGFTSEATVEAALQEIYQDGISVQHCILPSVITLEDGTAITKYATGGATPGWQQLSNKEVVLSWDGNATQTAIAVQFFLGDVRIDESANVVVHYLARMAGATDTPVIVNEAYFNAGDTDCAGTDDEVDGGATLTEYTNTILAADVPAAPAHLTVIFDPTNGEMTTDELYIYAIWLEVTSKLRTS